ncbi:WGxxGxxG family protein [Phytohabitans suffuscus]|uniref:WGxxGxxG family protein n=1 Tax=Phytohabitans suffuscus TaxID=624315 RepID=UPI0038CD2533
MRKMAAVVSLAAALSLTPVAAAPAEAHEAAARPAAVEPTPAPNQDNNDGSGDKGLNGLWGLLGLAGLAGLVRRRPKVEQGHTPRTSDTVRTEPREAPGRRNT